MWTRPNTSMYTKEVFHINSPAYSLAVSLRAPVTVLKGDSDCHSRMSADRVKYSVPVDPCPCVGNQGLTTLETTRKMAGCRYWLWDGSGIPSLGSTNNLSESLDSLGSTLWFAFDPVYLVAPSHSLSFFLLWFSGDFHATH